MNELMPTVDALAHAERMNVFTPTGLQLPEKLTDVDYYCIGVQISTLTHAVGWGRADLAYRIKQDFPQDYERRWIELAQLLGKVPPTIANDALVAAKYDHDEREWWMNAGLTYSHCRIAASVEPPERREYVLTLCVTEGWSVAQLSRELFPRPEVATPSHDELKAKYTTWLETLNESDRGYAEYYVSLFVEWMTTT